MIFAVFSLMLRLGRKRTKKEPKTPYHCEFTKNCVFRWFLPIFHSCFAWVESVPKKSKKRLITVSLRNLRVSMIFVALSFMLRLGWKRTKKEPKTPYHCEFTKSGRFDWFRQTLLLTLMKLHLWSFTPYSKTMKVHLWSFMTYSKTMKLHLWSFSRYFYSNLEDHFCEKVLFIVHGKVPKRARNGLSQWVSTIKGNVKESPTKTIKASQLRKLIVIRLFLLFLAQCHNHLFFLFQSSNLSFLSKSNCKTFFLYEELWMFPFAFKTKKVKSEIVFSKFLFRRKESWLKRWWLYVCCYLEPLQQ